MIHAENSCTNPPECRRSTHHIYPVKASNILILFFLFEDDLLCLRCAGNALYTAFFMFVNKPRQIVEAKIKHFINSIVSLS